MFNYLVSTHWLIDCALAQLTGCESLRLVLRHIIRFYFLQNFDRPLHQQCNSGYPVNWAQAIRLPRKNFCIHMGKQKKAAKGGASTQKGTSLTPLSHGGEADDTGEAVHNLRDDVDSLEERLSQMGALSRMPFRVMESSQSPSKDP